MDIYKNKSLENLSYFDDLGILRIEQWLPVDGFYESYEVSNLGRVKSLARFGKRNTVIICGTLDRHGYIIVALRKNSETFRLFVHRLVAIQFIPNPENKKEVNHKKGVLVDCRATELEWNTHSENNKHSYDVLGRKGAWEGKKGVLHHRSKQVVCESSGIKYGSTSEAERELSLPPKSVSAACLDSNRRAGGLKFKYVS